MCRGRTKCSELGPVEKWSNHAPLPPPPWIRAEISLLREAFTRAAAGDVAKAIHAVDSLADARCREWCVEHGQVSGRIRFRQLGRHSAATRAPAGDRRNPDRGLETAVYERDNYQCRYCGLPVIPRRLMVALGAVVGDARFPTGKHNHLRHGARLAFGAQVDHVVPFRSGGSTALENLVTACWSCNYGKASYALEQIGLSDPRERSPSTEFWDGCVPMFRELRRSARLAT